MKLCICTVIYELYGSCKNGLNIFMVCFVMHFFGSFVTSLNVIGL